MPLEYMFRARGWQSWARLAREGRLTAATARFWGPKPVEELYDLDADPHNVVNLAADPAHGRTLIRMREALKQQTLRIVDNGFLPEGSPLEGYEPSRRGGAYPLERVYDVAVLAATADRARLPELLAALDDPSEPVRWWAAQGCTVLGRGDHADLPRGEIAAALARRCADPSGGVRVAVAEALDAVGDTPAALAALEGELGGAGGDWSALQAANVLDRLGGRARPALATMKQLVAGRRSRPRGGGGPGGADRYPIDILTHAVAVLEGHAAGLVYPDIPPAESAAPVAADPRGP